MDRKRQEGGCDKVRLIMQSFLQVKADVSSNWVFEGHKTKTQGSPAQNYIAQPSSIITDSNLKHESARFGN